MMGRIVAAKRQLSDLTSLTSNPAGTPAITTSMVPYSTKLTSRPSLSMKTSERTTIRGKGGDGNDDDRDDGNDRRRQ